MKNLINDTLAETGKRFSNEHEKMLAKGFISKCKAVLELVKNNDLGCEIHIAGIEVGLVDNSKVIPAITHSIEEATKFINGEINEYE